MFKPNPKNPNEKMSSKELSSYPDAPRISMLIASGQRVFNLSIVTSQSPVVRELTPQSVAEDRIAEHAMLAQAAMGGANITET